MDVHYLTLHLRQGWGDAAHRQDRELAEDAQQMAKLAHAGNRRQIKMLSGAMITMVGSSGSRSGSDCGEYDDSNEWWSVAVQMRVSVWYSDGGS